MLNVTKLIIKNDLQYRLSDEEKSFLDTMELDEVRAIRKNILKNIRDGLLPLDILEDALEELKNSEYKYYLNNEGKNLDIEEQALYLEQIEGKCIRMIINLAKQNSTITDLLGPNIHETYGVNVKR